MFYFPSLAPAPLVHATQLGLALATKLHLTYYDDTSTTTPIYYLGLMAWACNKKTSPTPIAEAAFSSSASFNFILLLTWLDHPFSPLVYVTVVCQP
jgi:hypothetical protein